MNIENVKNDLRRKGITFEEMEVVKNGVVCRGFRILTGNNINPLVYYSPEEDEKELKKRIYDSLNHLPSIEVELLRDRNYILSHLYISMQKISEIEMSVKRRIMDLEAILRLHIGLLGEETGGSIKVPSSLLKDAGIDVEEAWESAISNMQSSFRVCSMNEILDMPSDFVPTTLYVVTTEEGVGGASALLYPEIFQEFCRNKGIESLLILQTSTEEVLMVPDDEELDFQEIVETIKDVNDSCVEPVIQLNPSLYRYDLFMNSITMVATLEN